MSTVNDLRRTQNLFWTLITAPEGVRPALEGMRNRGEIDGQSLGEVFAGDAEFPAVDRLDIYANMYFYRLLDCLREDYQRVEAVIGGSRFHNLITDYLIKHPSRRPSLRNLGESLPGFVASHGLGREFLYLADLARLEWSRVDAYDVPDETPLSREDLARLPQDRAGEASLVLTRSVRILHFDYDVVRLWRELRNEGDQDDSDRGTEGNAATEAHESDSRPRGPKELPRRKTAARVWRKDFIVYHKGINDEETRSLELIVSGEGLGRVCQTIAAGRSLTKATERIGRMLQSWLDDGIIANVNLPE